MYHIIRSSENKKEIEENKNECSENDPNPSLSVMIYHITFECLERDIKWLEWQKNADSIELTQLRIIRDMATLERMYCVKQTTVGSIFA